MESSWRSPHGCMAFAAWLYGFRRMVLWLSPHGRMAFAAHGRVAKATEEYWLGVLELVDSFRC